MAKPKSFKWRHVLSRRSAAAVGWFLATIGVLATFAGAAAARAADAASRAADLALVLPRRAVPQYVHIGQQVYLHRKQNTEKQTNSIISKQVASAMSSDLFDSLVPMAVKPSLLAAHRMISYRVRMLELYNHTDLSFSFA